MSTDRPAPGNVRVIVTDGERFAFTDVERRTITTFPELLVSTADALLLELDARRRHPYSST